MNKNVKLLYCILGSAVLAILNTPMLGYAKLGIFKGGYGGHILGELLVRITDLVSLLGFILLIIFSIALILSNIKFNLKQK